MNRCSEVEDNLIRMLREHPSKCLDCDYYTWCKYRVWIGDPKTCHKENEKNVGDKK